MLGDMYIEQITNLFDISQFWNALFFIFTINLLFIVIEIIVDFFRNKSRLWGDTGANIVIFFLGQLVERFVTSTFAFVVFLQVQQFALWEITVNTWTFILAIIAADFTYYCMHRVEHRYRILWAFHVVHHSSEDYNLSIALRLSSIESLVGWVFLLPMILVGFDPFAAIVAMTFIVQYQVWPHNEKINKIWLLDRWFNTPSVHRVHHGSNPQYIDKNYAGILLIWDKLFGTYEPENEKVIYGLVKNIKTNNPIKIVFSEFVNIWKDLRVSKNFKSGIDALLRVRY